MVQFSGKKKKFHFVILNILRFDKIDDKFDQKVIEVTSFKLSIVYLLKLLNSCKHRSMVLKYLISLKEEKK
jgi:hypothetical protein